jgi:general secretion pathway protein C
LVDWLRFSLLSRTDLRGLVSRRTVILALMAVMLFQGTGVLYKVLTLKLVRMKPTPAAVEKARSAPAALREPMDAYRIIPERNLFGTTSKTVAEKQAAAAPPQPDVALLIEIKGTIAGESRYGFAVVEDKANQTQRLVKVGDLVAGARVLRVKRNAVDFLVGDQERTLRMVETNEGPILPQSGMAAAAAVAAAAVVSPGTTVIRRSEVENNLQDMGSLLRQAQIRPYFNAGIPSGFLISNIRPGSIYGKMGISEGDVIQKVNNRPLQTADDMTGLLNTLKSGTGLSLTVLRQGKQETLNYQFQ